MYTYRTSNLYIIVFGFKWVVMEYGPVSQWNYTRLVTSTFRKLYSIKLQVIRTISFIMKRAPGRLVLIF